MPPPRFTSQSASVPSVNFNGGLNTTGGPLSLQDNESPDLQNVDFNKFGSVVKRNGYTTLNDTPIHSSTAAITAFANGGSGVTTVTSASHGLTSGNVVIQGTTSYNGRFSISNVQTNTFDISTDFVADDATGTWYEVKEGDGLHWYEFDSSGTLTRISISVSGGKFYKMDSLDGTWDDITGGLTITAGNHCDFENWQNKVFVTNNQDPPFEWDGTTAQTIQNTPTGLTDAKWVKQFNNYLFLANVVVSGTRHNSRIYWSDFKDEGAWTDTNFIEIALNDGQEITGLRVLSDRLVVYKSRSIYNIFFTGDANIPFVLPGGGKSNSEVGCASGYTVQDVKNGHVFMSQDGFYFYDGNNSFKISDKITDTFLGFVDTRFDNAVSMNQLSKNRYWVSLTSSGQAENDRVLIWDYFNNAWSLYKGISAASMAVFYVSGTEERPYFMDYSGFVYRADTGTSDHPDGTATDTAIDAYYVTNWRAYGDLVNQKGIPHLHIYYQNANTTMKFSYSYDFESGETYQQTFSLATSTDVYGTGQYGTAVYAGGGGATVRRDLTGRGRVIKLKFANAIVDETFQIDGLGQEAYLETNV